MGKKLIFRFFSYILFCLYL